MKNVLIIFIYFITVHNSSEFNQITKKNLDENDLQILIESLDENSILKLQKSLSKHSLKKTTDDKKSLNSKNINKEESQAYSNTTNLIAFGSTSKHKISTRNARQTNDDESHTKKLTPEQEKIKNEELKANLTQQNIDQVSSENSDLEDAKSQTDSEIAKVQERVKIADNCSKDILKELADKKKLIEEQNKELIKIKEESSYKNNMLAIKAVLDKNIEYQSFYDQIKLQIEREKDIRAEVRDKIKEVQETESKLNTMFNNLEINYVNKIDDIALKLDQIEITNKNLKKKILEIEEKNQKEQLTRQMLNVGIIDNDKKERLIDKEIKKPKIIEPKCVNRGSCRVCLEDPDCLWCKTDNTCKYGDTSGPFDGSCSKFSFQNCDATECTGNFTCEECISNEQCGWCGSTGICSEGGKFSPIGIVCPDNYIHMFKQSRCKTHEQYSFLSSK